jgi:hypothetical protein
MLEQSSILQRKKGAESYGIHKCFSESELKALVKESTD